MLTQIFAPENVQLFKDEINTMKLRVESMQDQGVMNSLEAMKLRSDKTEFLQNFDKPFLYILGEHDLFFSPDMIEKMQLPKVSTVKVLKKSGHIGLLEEPEESAVTIMNFIKSYLF